MEEDDHSGTTSSVGVTIAYTTRCKYGVIDICWRCQKLISDYIEGGSNGEVIRIIVTVCFSIRLHEECMHKPHNTLMLHAE